MSGSEATDDDLIRATAKGDKAAFTRLVTRHRSRLLALITRTLGNRAAAEDIVQDVFTRAWVNAPSWQARDQNRASYAAWLSRVAVNLSIDQLRKARPVTLDGIEEPQDPAEGAAAMETSVGAFELLLVRARRTLRQTLSEET
jgi:RNA polymerase sigma-70 factor (ECF subfamily)